MKSLLEIPTEKAERLEPYERITRFFAHIDDRPVLMIIDNADSVRDEDRAKLFEDLMDLSPRLHILTTSTNPIQLEGFDSNDKDLKLEAWHKGLFERYFKMRAHDLNDSKFSQLIRKGIKPYHFTRLYGT
mmetsp:Transcript_30068/g.41904  ORF Transcript_30068/g.41904 Transcript_30068/m.41904 type:complete len:130 (+) Transcript_30068:145-534(+)